MNSLFFCFLFFFLETANETIIGLFCVVVISRNWKCMWVVFQQFDHVTQSSELRLLMGQTSQDMIPVKTHPGIS